MENYSITCTL